MRCFPTVSQQTLSAIKVAADDSFAFSSKALWCIIHATESNCWRHYSTTICNFHDFQRLSRTFRSTKFEKKSEDFP